MTSPCSPAGRAARPGPAARRARAPLIALALMSALGAPAAAAEPVAAAPASPLTLGTLFERAWARHPEALAGAERRLALEARRRATDAWTPDAPAVSLGHRSDRFGPDEGRREWEAGVALPLWLPGERDGARALAASEAAALDARTAAARWRLAGELREAWWAWQRAAVEAALATDQQDAAQRLVQDVERRTRAGDLARLDLHQAQAALAAAQAERVRAQAAQGRAWRMLEALAPAAPGDAEPTRAAAPAAAAPPSAPSSAPSPTPSSTMPDAEPDPSPEESAATDHPALAEARAALASATRATALADVRRRASPELSLSATRERGARGERPAQTLWLGLRVPLGQSDRHAEQRAGARAEALEAQARLDQARARHAAERADAAERVQAAREALEAAERRARLAREARGFVERAFTLGERDLPELLRVDQASTEATRLAALARVDLAAASSAWRQALGLLPR